MKISKKYLRQIIQEAKVLNEQAEIPTVEVIDEGGTLTISSDTATEVEVWTWPLLIYQNQTHQLVPLFYSFQYQS